MNNIYTDIHQGKFTVPVGSSYRERVAIRNQFRHAAIEFCGLLKHSKANVAFEMAWDDKHAEGYIPVVDRLLDLADLML